MSRFLVVSKLDRLQEYKAIADAYGVGFEINDFYEPRVLDDEKEQSRMVEKYLENGVPDDSTMHGAFLDVVVFSSDERIAEISKLRMRQSVEIAKKLGVKGVVFHTNCNPMLAGDIYDNNVVSKTVAFMEELLQELLEEHSSMQLYLENMFDDSPKILAEISQHLCKYQNYGVCLDYAHASISTVPMSDWVDALAPYLKHIHINDNDLKKDLHGALGTGQIDWNQFVKYYHTHFDQCSVLIEATEPEAQIQSLNYLKENFVGLFREC